jgi:hypothetical protein
MHLISLIGIVAIALIAAMGMANTHNLRDAALKLTRALPNGAATVTAATAIDTGQTTNIGSQDGVSEYLLTAPAMTTAQMPDAKTMKYDILFSANADLSAPTVYITSAITQTGAGGVGCAAATFRFRLPSDALRYVGFRATGSAAGDATGASATLEVLI